MRELVDGENTYRLTEKQHKQLLKRFDVSRAKNSGFGSNAISISCICPRGNVRCVRCCLGGGLNRMGYPNCLKIMDHLAGVHPPYVRFNVVYIAWPEGSEGASAYIQRVREILLALPEVK